MEPTPTPSQTEAQIGAALERIRAAVDGGNADLRALGFWPVVAKVKRDPDLVARFADAIGAIDTAAFRRSVRLRAPVWAGNALLLAVIAVGVGAIVVATDATGAVAGLGLLVAGGAWSLGVHVPTHWLVGRLQGIGFTDSFLGGPAPPRPGIKTDYATYLRTPANARAWFHASGAIATKIAPFVAVALAPLTNAPGWSVALMAAYGVLQIVTDAVFSVKTSDWKKFRRERAIARDLG
ncbi:MAG: hypothetical protein ACM3OO_11050 [Planctomycetaceae bacterium]